MSCPGYRWASVRACVCQCTELWPASALVSSHWRRRWSVTRTSGSSWPVTRPATRRRTTRTKWQGIFESAFIFLTCDIINQAFLYYRVSIKRFICCWIIHKIFWTPWILYTCWYLLLLLLLLYILYIQNTFLIINIIFYQYTIHIDNLEVWV